MNTQVDRDDKSNQCYKVSMKLNQQVQLFKDEHRSSWKTPKYVEKTEAIRPSIVAKSQQTLVSFGHHRREMVKQLL